MMQPRVPVSVDDGIVTVETYIPEQKQLTTIIFKKCEFLAIFSLLVFSIIRLYLSYSPAILSHIHVSM